MTKSLRDWKLLVTNRRVFSSGIRGQEYFQRKGCCALSAVAAAKGQPAIAEAVLELSPEVAAEFMEWLYERYDAQTNLPPDLREKPRRLVKSDG